MKCAYPFYALYVKIDSNNLKMSGFSSKNAHNSRYQDTDLLLVSYAGKNVYSAGKTSWVLRGVYSGH